MLGLGTSKQLRQLAIVLVERAVAAEADDNITAVLCERAELQDPLYGQEP